MKTYKYFWGILSLTIGCSLSNERINYSLNEIDVKPEPSIEISEVYSRSKDKSSTDTTNEIDNDNPLTHASRLVLLNKDKPNPIILVVNEAKQEYDNQDEEISLGLADLQQLALENNPLIKQSEARVNALQGKWLQVGLYPNPKIGYSGSQLGSNGQAEQQGAFVSQEIVTANKLKLNRKIAAWDVEKAKQELEVNKLKVLNDVKIGFYRIQIAHKRIDFAKNMLEISQQAKKNAELLFNGQEVSQADPLRAEIEVKNAEIVYQNSLYKSTEAWRNLTNVIGVEELKYTMIEEEINPNLKDLNYSTLQMKLLEESPEISAINAEIEAAEWNINRAYAEVFPNVEINATIQDDRGTGSSNGNLEISIPIPLWNRNQGEICRAKAISRLKKNEKQLISLNLQSRLAEVYQRYQSSKNQVEMFTSKDGILDKAKDSYNIIEVGYKAGEFSLLDLVSNQRVYFQTNLNYLDSLEQLLISNTEINGLLLKNSLGTEKSN